MNTFFFNRFFPDKHPLWKAARSSKYIINTLGWNYSKLFLKLKSKIFATLSQPVCFLPLCPLNGQRNCLRRLQKPSETKPSKVLVYSALPEKFGNLKNSDVSRGPVAVHKIHALNPCMHFNNRVTPVPYRNGTRTWNGLISTWNIYSAFHKYHEKDKLDVAWS